MKYLIKSGNDLKGTILSIPVAGVLYGSSTTNDVTVWIDAMYDCLFETSSYVRIYKAPRQSQFDVFVNMSERDEKVVANVSIDYIGRCWGDGQHIFAPKAFLHSLGKRYNRDHFKLYASVKPDVRRGINIGICNSSDEDIRIMSDDILGELIDRLLYYKNNMNILIIDCEDEYDDNRIETISGPVRKIMNTIASLDMLISIDSGPAYLSSALGVKTVIIFSDTDWISWSPSRSNVMPFKVQICQCYKCIRRGGRDLKCVENVRCIDKLNTNLLANQAVNFMNE